VWFIALSILSNVDSIRCRRLHGVSRLDISAARKASTYVSMFFPVSTSVQFPVTGVQSRSIGWPRRVSVSEPFRAKKSGTAEREFVESRGAYPMEAGPGVESKLSEKNVVDSKLQSEGLFQCCELSIVIVANTWGGEYDLFSQTTPRERGFMLPVIFASRASFVEIPEMALRRPNLACQYLRPS
jgi:hypothetical protein